MVHDGDKVVVEKGLTPDEFWAKWEQRPAGPVVFHSRIGTHGHNDVHNCHPFKVPNHGMHMAHNGIIHECASTKSPLSDTRRFVRGILSGLPVGFLESRAHCRLIEKFIGGSRLVFMDDDGGGKSMNEDLGHWYRPHHKNRKKRWYSNYSYLPPKPVVTPKGLFDETMPWYARGSDFAPLRPMEESKSKDATLGPGWKLVKS